MQTVVGVFDSVDDAERARESVLRAGFDGNSVRVQAQPARPSGDSVGAARHADDGVMASIGRFFSDLFGDQDEHAGHYSEAVRRGGSVVVVTVADKSQVDGARAALASAGAVDIDKRADAWRQQGYSRFDPASPALQSQEVETERSRSQTNLMPGAVPGTVPGATALAGEGTVLPVIREALEVGKRQVDLGVVRVHTRTETRPVQEQVELREERAEIQRRSVDRPASEADLKAFEGGSIEVHETAERAVVSKTARVVEEVLVGKQATSRTETISDQVRNTVVDVENAGNDRAASQGAIDYRSHYESNLAGAGGTFEDYEPAYRYGGALRSDARYADRSWNEVEADAQRDWGSRNPNSNWEQVKQAARHGWESMTGRR